MGEKRISKVYKLQRINILGRTYNIQELIGLRGIENI
jgi:hypothetical protein